MKQEVNQIMAEQYKNGWCPIEHKITLFMQCENKKWVCISGDCSYASGQYDEPPKPPESPKKINYLNFERRL